MKKLLFPIFVLSTITLSAQGQNVGISTTGVNPDNSAMLDVSSTDKGLLVPRIALSQTNVATPVTGPATSLLVYNTSTSNDVTPGYYYWDGAKWERMIVTGNVSQIINDSLVTNVYPLINNNVTNISNNTAAITNAVTSITNVQNQVNTHLTNDLDTVIGNEYNTSFTESNGVITLVDGGGSDNVNITSTVSGIINDSLVTNVYPLINTNTGNISTNSTNITTNSNSITTTNTNVSNLTTTVNNHITNDLDIVVGNEYNNTFTESNGVISLADGGGTKTVNVNSTIAGMINDSLISNIYPLLGGSDWSINGNNGTDPAFNFLGTKDNQPLVFKVFNEKAGRIEPSAFNGNTSIGFQTLNVTAGTQNSAFGWRALTANTGGVNNVAMGYMSLLNNTDGMDNVGIGTLALSNNTIGESNISIGGTMASNIDGNFNVGIGSGALYQNVSGSSNVGVGVGAGGGSAGINFNNCVFIGRNSQVLTARNNIVTLGANVSDGQCTGNNQIMLGSTAITEIRAQVGGITTYSDERFKSNIEENVAGLDFIMNLSPVTYNVNPEILHDIWQTPDSLRSNIDHTEIKEVTQIGLIAQEVEKAAKKIGWEFPGLNAPTNDKEVYSIRYTDLIMPMIKSIQEQQAIIEKQQEQIDLLLEQLEK